jgi:hypothetical protein
VVPNGFNVYVFCFPKEQARLNALVNAESETRLSGRARFTIAHELAHIFFYSKGEPPKDRFPAGTPKAHARLERLCNEISAEMLLPTSLVREHAKTTDFRSPKSIRSLCDRAVVSPEVLVIKAAKRASWFHDPGGVLAFQREAGGWVLKASALHGMIDIFGNLKRGTPLEEIVRVPEFHLNGGPDLDVTAFVNFRTARSLGFQRVRFSSEWLPPARQTAIVTLQTLGEPQYI